MKNKIVSMVTIPANPNRELEFAFNVYLFLNRFSDNNNPYKVGQFIEHADDSGFFNDFWFKKLIDGNQIDMLRSISGIDIKFWTAFKPGEGLYVIMLKDKYKPEDSNSLYKQIVEEGELLLTDPEFRIHARLQEKYFKNEKDVEWN